MFPTSAETAPAAPTLPDRSTKRVVAIGTAAGNADLIEETVQSLDCLFESVSSSEELEGVLAEPQSVSLAVVDVRSVTDRVRRLCRRLDDHDVSVLLLTSRLSATFATRLRQTPRLTAHQKPVERTTLAQEIRSLLTVAP